MRGLVVVCLALILDLMEARIVPDTDTSPSAIVPLTRTWFPSSLNSSDLGDASLNRYRPLLAPLGGIQSGTRRQSPVTCKQSDAVPISGDAALSSTNASMLVSFPRSGNTFIRYLLEKASGHMTGSMYTDPAMQAYFKGALRSHGVLCVKTHELFASNSGLGSRLRSRRAVFIARDPFAAVLSLFERRLIGWGNSSMGDHQRAARLQLKQTGEEASQAREEFRAFAVEKVRAAASMYRGWVEAVLARAPPCGPSSERAVAGPFASTLRVPSTASRQIARQPNASRLPREAATASSASASPEWHDFMQQRRLHSSYAVYCAEAEQSESNKTPSSSRSSESSIVLASPGFKRRLLAPRDEMEVLGISSEPYHPSALQRSRSTAGPLAFLPVRFEDIAGWNSRRGRRRELELLRMLDFLGVSLAGQEGQFRGAMVRCAFEQQEDIMFRRNSAKDGATAGSGDASRGACSSSAETDVCLRNVARRRLRLSELRMAGDGESATTGTSAELHKLGWADTDGDVQACLQRDCALQFYDLSVVLDVAEHGVVRRYMQAFGYRPVLLQLAARVLGLAG